MTNFEQLTLKKDSTQIRFDRIFERVLMRLENNEFDPKSIMMLYRFSAFGLSSAQNELAHVLGLRGYFQDAIELYKMAAFSEPHTAIFNMAITYREMGRINDFLFWMIKLAKSGDNSAQEELSSFFGVSLMTPEEP
jgi:hypothetical protein